MPPPSALLSRLPLKVARQPLLWRGLLPPGDLVLLLRIIHPMINHQPSLGQALAPSPPTTGSRQRNNRPSVVVPGDCSSVTRAQEPASQVVLTPDSVTSMYWLHGQLHLHDYHPAYNEETITNDPRLDEETVMAGSAWSDNQDYTGTGAAVAGSVCNLPDPSPPPTVAFDILSSVKRRLSRTPTRRTPPRCGLPHSAPSSTVPLTLDPRETWLKASAKRACSKKGREHYVSCAAQ